MRTMVGPARLALALAHWSLLVTGLQAGDQGIPVRCTVALEDSLRVVQLENLATRSGVFYQPYFLLPKSGESGMRVSALLDPKTGRDPGYDANGLRVEVRVPMDAKQQVTLRVPQTGLIWTRERPDARPIVRVSLEKAAPAGLYRLSFGMCASAPGLDVDVTPAGELRLPTPRNGADAPRSP